MVLIMEKKKSFLGQMHSKFSIQLGCVLFTAEGHLEILTVMQRWFPKASEDKARPTLYQRKVYRDKMSECNRERLWKMSAHLGWEVVQRNRVLTGVWTSPGP